MHRMVAEFHRGIVIVAIFCTSFVGCSTLDHTTKDALIGSGLGAATGAIIGHQSGNRGAGAALGAVTGVIAGSLVGNAKDAREERDAAYAYAHQVEQEQRAAQLAITNNHVIGMACSGAGDAVIMNAIRSRGGRFDVSPEAIVQLKQNGVSDAVIYLMQQQQSENNAAPHAAVVKPATVVTSPSVYVAAPRPLIGRWFFGRPRPARYGNHRGRHRFGR